MGANGALLGQEGWIVWLWELLLCGGWAPTPGEWAEGSWCPPGCREGVRALEVAGGGACVGPLKPSPVRSAQPWACAGEKRVSQGGQQGTCTDGVWRCVRALDLGLG